MTRLSRVAWLHSGPGPAGEFGWGPAAHSPWGVCMRNDFGLRHPGRREAAVAVAVACLVVLVSWLGSRGGGDKAPAPSDTPTALSSSPQNGVVNLDVSPDVTPDEVEACLTPEFASHSDEVEVLYAERQRTETGDQPVLVLRNGADELRLCDSFGGSAPSVAPVQYADAAHPVRFLSNGRQSWDCDGTRLTGFTISHWLSVNDVVDRVDLRFVSDGVTGPWYVSQAQNGFVHAHGWLREQTPEAKVAIEVRILDSAGSVVPQSTMPTEPQPVEACAGRGAELG